MANKMKRTKAAHRSAATRPGAPAAKATNKTVTTAPRGRTASGRRKQAAGAPSATGPGARGATKRTTRPTKSRESEKIAKLKKPKLVRDSFTMPKPEYEVIDSLKKRCLRAGVSAKKSQILRAAIANLAKLSDTSLTRLIQGLEVIKTGRPKKSK